MKATKIKALDELSDICKGLRKKGKVVGLITGCFDILHINHITLFENAKDEVDILIVGIENDETIKLSKGSHRPINTQSSRLRFLSALNDVDYVFLIEGVYSFKDGKIAEKHHKQIIKHMQPDYLITNRKADSYWETKKKRLIKSNTKLIDIGTIEASVSTTIIEKKLMSED